MTQATRTVCRSARCRRFIVGCALAALWAGGFAAPDAGAAGPLDPFPIEILDNHNNCVAVADHRLGRVTLEQYERISGLGPADLERIKDGTAPGARTVAQWHHFRVAFARAARED